MEENKAITLSGIIKQIIKENHLSEVDEDEIRKILEEKGKRDEDRGTCLAVIVEKEMEKNIKNGIEMGEISESAKKLSESIIKEYFKKSEIGNIPSYELSETQINKFIMKFSEIHGKDRRQMLCFMGLLQVGLNKMSENNMLNFTPNKYLYRDYVGHVKGVKYIKNPYTTEEIGKIMQWIDKHPDDIRGLAVGLWFNGDISMTQIANLRKKDCQNGMFKKPENARIISGALKLHKNDEEYLFMVRKKEGWEKLTGKSLQVKLYYICEGLGFEYKRIHKDEAVMYKSNKS